MITGTARRYSGRPRVALATLSLVLFLTFLDNTIVSVVLADVQSSLKAGVSALQWVINGYALVFAGLMLSFGTLGDLFGRKKVMLGGVAVFLAGSVVSAVAPDSATLVAGRVVMGVGAAASEPGTLSLIRHVWPDRRERARALGVWAAVSGLALALGPVIGGALSGVWSWRAVFWFNVFLGLIAFAGAAATLPESADRQGRRLDVPGFLLGSGSLVMATVAVISGETAGYRAWWIILLFAAAGVAFIGFLLVEKRAANPVLDLAFFRRPGFSGANLAAFALYFGVFAIFFFVALYLQVVGNQSGYRTAVHFVPMAGAMIVASLLGGRWVAASGPRIPLAVGCAVAAAGILLTQALLTAHSGLWPMGWTLAVAGAGFGLALVPVTSAPLSAVPAEHSGMAAAATNTSRELGAAAGVAILGSVVNGELTVQLAHRLAALGIPTVFRQTVITAVTTGNFEQSQAQAIAGSNPAIAHIVDEVVNAAYGAFARGLDLSLWIAAALLLFTAAVVGLTVRRGPAASGVDAWGPEAAQAAP